jgi:hypothetical protein
MSHVKMKRSLRFSNGTSKKRSQNENPETDLPTFVEYPSGTYKESQNEDHETNKRLLSVPEQLDNSLDIKWVIISLAVSLVLAKFSKQSMCTYMYLSLAWLYITILVTQSWQKFERNNIQIASTTIASLIGWLVGTLVVWRTKHHHNAFFE